MKKIGASFLAMLVCCFILVACTDTTQKKSEKGTIDKITDEAADAAVQAIKTPIDKAKNVEVEQKARLEAQQKEIEEKQE